MSASVTLEPKVAKLEADIVTLTRDTASIAMSVKELARTVQAQSEQTEIQFRQLAVAIERAGGPRKTEWQLILTGIAVIIAIGGIAYSPLNHRIATNEAGVEKILSRIHDHETLELHPVGAAKIASLTQAIEKTELRIANEAALLRQSSSEKAAAIQVQLETLRDKSLPPITDRLAVMDQRLLALEKREPIIKYQLQPTPDPKP